MLVPVYVLMLFLPTIIKSLGEISQCLTWCESLIFGRLFFSKCTTYDGSPFHSGMSNDNIRRVLYDIMQVPKSTI
jgi:hypothetical protein